MRILPRAGRSVAAALAGWAALAGACAPRAAPWRQVDLAFAAQRLEDLDGKARRGSAERRVVPLGPPDLRDPTARPRAPAAAIREATLPPGRVLALAQPANTRLVFSLAVGAEAFVEFRPFGAADSPARHRVLLRRAGVERELWRAAEPSADWPPPEMVQVALPAAPIDLLFELRSLDGGPREGLWVSPRLVFRDPAARPRRPPGEERPNLVLLGADTLRADALGAYGRRPSLTPALDALAAESDVWLEAFTTFNITAPSFASILTGLYGREHGLYDNRSRAAPELVTIAELLAERGYATAAFLSARHLETSGIAQGFAEVAAPERHGAGELAVNQAMDWLEEVREPFFLWVHLYDPHTPHSPPGRAALGYVPAEPSGLRLPERWVPFRAPGPLPFRQGRLAAHERLYEGEVVYLDRQVGRLLDVLRSRDGLARTVIAVVADHGENLGEHDLRFNHWGLFEPVVRVPLMIRWAGRARQGRRLTGLVQTLDLFPTLVRAAGLEAPATSGKDLLELAAAGGRPAIYAEQMERRGPMVRTRRHKFFFERPGPSAPGSERLYDLDADPAEGTNVAARDPLRVARLSALLARWSAPAGGVAAAATAALDARELAELHSLGYLD